MIQVKFIYGRDFQDLNENLNKALLCEPLSELNSEQISINYELAKQMMILVEYELQEAHKERLCCECALWDDMGKTESLSGFCTITGNRMRFNCSACKKFKDIRS